MRTEDTDVLQAGFGRSWRDRNELFDPPAVADRILTDLSWAQHPAEAPAGKVPVVLPPEAFGHLLGAVLGGIHGRSVARGESPLAGRLGQQILDEKLTIVDRPHMDYADGAREIDADGIATRRLTLFEGGTLKTFLYDLDSAGLAGAEPTGNDDCRPYNVVVTPGTSTSEELIAGIDDGLLVRNLIGFGQGNILNGDFSCNVGLGFRIRGGEVVGRVKNTMLAGNVYDLLGAGVRLSSDTDYQGRLPWAVVEGASVSRSG
jgi:PmbA protein